MVASLGTGSLAEDHLPVRAMLRHACGLTTAEPPVASAVKVCQRLARVGMTPEDWAPYLLRLLDVPIESDPLATLSPQAIRAHTTEILVQMACQGARRQPLVLAVENLHWIDPNSEAVLTALVERLAGTSILLLTTFRPGYHPSWLDKSYASQVALARLTPADSRQVVQASVGAIPVAEALVHTILVKAEGNPFFLEELTRAVVEHHAAQRALAVMPETVQAVIAARLDRLPPPAKRLLQVAAVIGKDVPYPLLQAVAGLPEEALSQRLAQPRTGEFLYEVLMEGTPGYTFKHVLTQEVAYQSLLADTRQQYHQRIAQVLTEQLPTTAETQPELLAYHYTEAGLAEQAIPYWQRAGRQALQGSANLEAVQAPHQGPRTAGHAPHNSSTGPAGAGLADRPGPSVDGH
jgi:predicted ATPase